MVSNNVISTHCTVIVSGISKTPPHLLSVYFFPALLSSSDLSSNPFECHCKLFRLVSWLQAKGVRVRRPDAMLCDHPPERRHQPLLNITCGTKHVSLDAFCWFGQRRHGAD